MGEFRRFIDKSNIERYTAHFVGLRKLFTYWQIPYTFKPCTKIYHPYLLLWYSLSFHYRALSFRLIHSFYLLTSMATSIPTYQMLTTVIYMDATLKQLLTFHYFLYRCKSFGKRWIIIFLVRILICSCFRQYITFVSSEQINEGQEYDARDIKRFNDIDDYASMFVQHLQYGKIFDEQKAFRIFHETMTWRKQNKVYGMNESLLRLKYIFPW